ncbi:MAG: M14 family zinc carboxypeptidase [Phenylobacterium sp.]
MKSALLAGVALALVWQGAAVAQAHITTPKEAFNGSEPGDDYFLANYDQTTAYWKKLAAESDRVKLVSLGKSVEGRDIWMAVVSSPENLKKLDHYVDIDKRLALAKGVSEAEAHALAREGKAMVWIDGGLHASECRRPRARSRSSTRCCRRTIRRRYASSTTTSRCSSCRTRTGSSWSPTGT